MKNFLIGLFTFIGTTGINAQTQSITVHSQTTGKEEIIDVPESMQSEMDSLYWDWQSKNYITLGENCTMASTNPVVSDSIYMDRLSRIPSIIEMPYNEAVRKFIDMYAVRLRNKVSFMLAATNFYMPIFEEALDLYDLPQELKYLPAKHLIFWRPARLIPDGTPLISAELLFLNSLYYHNQYLPVFFYFQVF